MCYVVKGTQIDFWSSHQVECCWRLFINWRKDLSVLQVNAVIQAASDEGRPDLSHQISVSVHTDFINLVSAVM